MSTGDSGGRKRSEITRLLDEWQRGDEASFEALLPIVYDELKQIAHSLMRRERASHTLQTTAVVHEAWLRMIGLDRLDSGDRAYFFGAAARIMRRVLIDHARLHRAQKRNSGEEPLPLDESIVMDSREADDLLVLNEALSDLEALDPRQCRVVELRHFAGLSVEEAASVLGVSEATIKRDWKLARVWLHRRLAGGSRS